MWSGSAHSCAGEGGGLCARAMTSIKASGKVSAEPSKFVPKDELP